MREAPDVASSFRSLQAQLENWIQRSPAMYALRITSKICVVRAALVCMCVILPRSILRAWQHSILYQLALLYTLTHTAYYIPQKLDDTIQTHTHTLKPSDNHRHRHLSFARIIFIMSLMATSKSENFQTGGWIFRTAHIATLWATEVACNYAIFGLFLFKVLIN